jgi:hypothetical protein
MAFSFGASNFAAPAPATGFNFASTNPGGSSGSGVPSWSNNTTSSSSTSGFNFGGGGTSLFGSNPAASAAPTGIFGSSATAAPTPGPTGLFGSSSSSTAAAPSGLFGTPTTPAPFSTGSFSGLGSGNTAPTTTTTGLFGSPTALQQQQQQQQQQQPQPVNAYTPYSALPENAKRLIDQIHSTMMAHRRTMFNVSHMSPALLSLLDHERTTPCYIVTPGIDPNQQQRTSTHGGSTKDRITTLTTADSEKKPITYQLEFLNSQLLSLEQQIQLTATNAKQLHSQGQQASDNVTRYASWPCEVMAQRRGIPTAGDNTALEAKMRQFMSEQAVQNVDWIEQIPSPFMWDTLQSLDSKLHSLLFKVNLLKNDLNFMTSTTANHTADAAAGDEQSNKEVLTAVDICNVVQAQQEAFLRLAAIASSLHDELQLTKVNYLRAATAYMNIFQDNSSIYKSSRSISPTLDPFQKADAQELEEEHRLQARIRASVAAATAAAATNTNTPAKSTTNTFPDTASGLGLSSTLAPSGTSLFGTPTPSSPFVTTPSSTTGTKNLFGATSTFLSTPTNLNPSTPTITPVTPGGLFGSGFGTNTTVPSNTLFGASNPSSSGGLFGGGGGDASSSRARKKSSGGVRSRR